jgi:hypothetical protein
MSHGKSYLPTEPGTQVTLSTSRPWCAGHRWRDRNRVLWWAHYLGHRGRMLRVKTLPRPLVYLVDTKAADPGDFPCCAPAEPEGGQPTEP